MSSNMEVSWKATPSILDRIKAFSRPGEDNHLFQTFFRPREDSHLLQTFSRPKEKCHLLQTFSRPGEDSHLLHTFSAFPQLQPKIKISDVKKEWFGGGDSNLKEEGGCNVKFQQHSSIYHARLKFPIYKQHLHFLDFKLGA